MNSNFFLTLALFAGAGYPVGAYQEFAGLDGWFESRDMKVLTLPSMEFRVQSRPAGAFSGAVYGHVVQQSISGSMPGNRTSFQVQTAAVTLGIGALATPARGYSLGLFLEKPVYAHASGALNHRGVVSTTLLNRFSDTGYTGFVVEAGRQFKSMQVFVRSHTRAVSETRDNRDEPLQTNDFVAGVRIKL